MNALTPIQKAVKDLKLIVTSHSIDNLFDYCARKFEFAHRYERRPVFKESGYAADVGTALHRGTQAWLIARHEGLSESEARIRGAFDFMLHFPWEEEVNQGTNVRSFDNCVVALEDIWARPEWNEWELVKVERGGKTAWAVEVPWLMIHSSLGPVATGEYLATQGTIDFIMRHKVSHKICPWDLKTTIQSMDLNRSKYEFSGQQVGYGQVVEALLNNKIRELTVFYMVVQISGQGSTIEVLDIHKSQDALEDYWLDKLDRLARIKAYVARGRFPRTNGGCFSYNTECAFFDVCKSRDDDFLKEWFADSENAQFRDMPDWWVLLEV